MIRRWRPTPFNVVQAVAAGTVVLRLLPGARRPLPLQPRPGPLPGAGTVAVIVPARDEEHRIGPLLAAVCADPQVHEVVVVDDESSDATAAVARGAGARVVTGRSLPAGWVGKPWALQQGLEAAASEWIVTLDADVVPRPGFVGALLDAATAGGWDVLTVGPRFVLGGPGPGHDVSVEGHHPVRGHRLQPLLQRPRLAHPTGRQRPSGHHSGPGAPGHGRSGIGRLVVDHHHLVHLGIGGHRRQQRPDAALLVTGRHDHGHGAVKRAGTGLQGRRPPGPGQQPQHDRRRRHRLHHVEEGGPPAPDHRPSLAQPAPGRRDLIPAQSGGTPDPMVPRLLRAPGARPDEWARFAAIGPIAFSSKLRRRALRGTAPRPGRRGRGGSSCRPRHGNGGRSGCGRAWPRCSR